MSNQVIDKVNQTLVNTGTGVAMTLVGAFMAAQRLTYNAQNLPEYEGVAPVGSDTAANVWAIKKYNYSGTNLTHVQWGSGTANFDKKWDDRASYSYV